MALARGYAMARHRLALVLPVFVQVAYFILISLLSPRITKWRWDIEFVPYVCMFTFCHRFSTYIY